MVLWKDKGKGHQPRPLALNPKPLNQDVELWKRKAKEYEERLNDTMRQLREHDDANEGEVVLQTQHSAFHLFLGCLA